MGTLQEELLKAGLITQDRAKKIKSDESRKKWEAKHPEKKAKPVVRKPIPKKAPPPKPKPPEKVHEHHLRTLCEACGKTSPDVEYYQHTHRNLGKYWLCIQCADMNNILDDTRQTHQSPMALKSMFIRRWGATKVFPPLPSRERVGVREGS